MFAKWSKLSTIAFDFSEKIFGLLLFFVCEHSLHYFFYLCLFGVRKPKPCQSTDWRIEKKIDHIDCTQIYLQLSLLFVFFPASLFRSEKIFRRPLILVLISFILSSQFNLSYSLSFALSASCLFFLFVCEFHCRSRPITHYMSNLHTTVCVCVGVRVCVLIGTNFVGNWCFDRRVKRTQWESENDSTKAKK